MNLEEQLIFRINRLHKVQRAYAGLVDPKFVNIRGNKHCTYCNQLILSGQRALTSSLPVDKKYNMNYKYAYDNNCVKEHKFVLVRTWAHTQCIKDLLYIANNMDSKDKWYKKLNFDEIDLAKLDDNEALEIMAYFYNKGEIPWEEYKHMEMALINSIAYRDAEGIGQI